MIVQTILAHLILEQEHFATINYNPPPAIIDD